jgi:hypothetical protein
MEFPVTGEPSQIAERRYAHETACVEVISWRMKLKIGGKYEWYFYPIYLISKN